jgi:demethylmenaquinone methyltransferase/2-methoxy-6-polyprenyl-1,4-benzoquinol methylase
VRARAAVDELDWRGRDVLELAPGTGIWTERLLSAGASLTVVDASMRMLRQLLRRLGDSAARVTVVNADIFEYEAPRRFGGLFAGFFVSHVPRARLDGFFDMIGRALAPGGIIALVDSLREETSTARDHVLTTGEVMERRLDDGRTFKVVKNFYEPVELSAAAGRAGIELDVATTGRYFYVAAGRSVR